MAKTSEKKGKGGRYKRNRKGSIILGKGKKEFTVTQRELDEYKANLKKVNKLRKQMVKSYISDEIKGKNIMKGISNEAYIEKLESRNLLPRERKSTSLHGFKSKKAWDLARKLAKKQAKQSTMDNKTKEIKKKMYERIREQLPKDQANKIIHMLGRMSKEEFIALYLQDDYLIRELFYITDYSINDYAEFTRSRIALARSQITSSTLENPEED